VVCGYAARPVPGASEAFMTVDTVTVHDDIKLHDDGRVEPSSPGQPKAKGHHHGKVETAIVLQGGGALGAYEYGVLKALYERRPGFEPIAVTGISIGAITAAVLGGAKSDPIAALDELWRNRLTVSSPLPIPWLPPLVEQSLAVYGNPGMYWLNPELYLSPYTATSLYDTAPLRTTLADLVDPIRLTREKPRVVVGAINVGSGEMEFFDPLGPGGLTFDHVLASGSLPPGFPMTAIGEELYWDGGLFSNAPLGPAINALEEVDGDPGVARELIVVELFPMRAPVPGNLPAVFDRMQRLQYTSRLKLDQAFFDKINGMVDVLARVDRELPLDSPLRDDTTYKQLCAHRKIDHFNVVTSTLPAELSNASDFSRSTIRARIQAGYQDAIAQGIGSVNSPGLRPGTIGRGPHTGG
jgi:NTE family protein